MIAKMIDTNMSRADVPALWKGLLIRDPQCEYLADHQVSIKRSNLGVRTGNAWTLDTEEMPGLQRRAAHPRELRHSARQIRLGHHE